MKFKIEILRQKDCDSQPYFQTVEYENSSAEATAAIMLKELNADESLADIEGEKVGKIEWQCSCLQKKCGACAMLINGVPRLACDTKLAEFKKGKIRLEPLKKFPTIKDLIVDRSAMFENLEAISLWLESEARLNDKRTEIAYEASRCLQCGCCLEVCPNFMTGGSFFGASAFVPASRIIAELDKNAKYKILESYRKNIYSGCGKSLACHNICPAGIDVEKMLVNSNAAAVWRRFL